MWLSLSPNHIEGSTPLRSLTHLEHLLVNSHEVAELPLLDSLTALKPLSLYGTCMAMPLRIGSGSA